MNSTAIDNIIMLVEKGAHITIPTYVKKSETTFLHTDLHYMDHVTMIKLPKSYDSTFVDVYDVVPNAYIHEDMPKVYNNVYFSSELIPLHYLQSYVTGYVLIVDVGDYSPSFRKLLEYRKSYDMIDIKSIDSMRLA